MMTKINKITKALSNGLLSFPITDMDDDGNFSNHSYQSRISWFLEHEISAVFVAGGTGEFFSLGQKEYEQIVETATSTVSGKVPVISSIGRSIPEAVEFARIAESSGIDALLLMPPYLTDCSEEGAYLYAKTIIENTELPVIYYNRSNGILSTKYLERLSAECPNLIGLKDGTGNIQELNDTIKSIGKRLVYIGGVPTAEIISEAYMAIGVSTYSSAVFNFVPELANLFYNSLRNGKKEITDRILREFFIPFVRLRKKGKGYAVSLIKSGAKIIGKSGGNVRPPLLMPSREEEKELELIINKARIYTDQAV